MHCAICVDKPTPLSLLGGGLVGSDDQKQTLLTTDQLSHRFAYTEKHGMII